MVVKKVVLDVCCYRLSLFYLPHYCLNEKQVKRYVYSSKYDGCEGGEIYYEMFVLPPEADDCSLL